MKLLISILILCLPMWVCGQTGNYFLSHYSPSDERFDNVCFDMAQDEKGVMYFATKAGILEFNGRDWDLLQGSSAIYSIQISKQQIFWAGAKGFGKVSLDHHGFQQIELLSDSLVSDVFQSVVINEEVFFLSEDEIFRFNTINNKITKIKAYSHGDTFIKLFELYGVGYVSTDNGIFKIEETKLAPSKLDLSGEISFYSRVGNSYVVGTSENKIYACEEDLKFRAVPLKDQAYLDMSVIVSGSWLNHELLALGTLRGGVVFVNPLNGLTEEIINYSTGLPDNEVFQLMTDVNQNVWVSHDYGFTKIAPYMPVRSFSHYQGLQGNLLCAMSSKNTVYVGTSLGLFKLEKVDLYDELVYYVDVEIKAPKQQVSKNRQVATRPKIEEKIQPEETQKAESRKGGLFSFLKKKNKTKIAEINKEKKPDTPQIDHSTKIDNDASQEVNTPKFRRVKKTEKVLRSSQYVFRKVQGVDAKITHLVEVKGKILASGLGGLYEINNLIAAPVLDEPVRFLYAPANRDIVIVSTYNDDVRILRFGGKYIENTSLFANLDDQINYAFEGNQNELWLCGLDKIYRTQINESEVKHKLTIPLSRSNSDKTVGTVFNNEILLANVDGFFQFNRDKNLFVKIDTLPRPSEYFAHQGGIVYLDRHGWNFVGNSGPESNLQLLNVFEDLRFIASDQNTLNLWLISGGNELYKFFGDKITPLENEFPVFLKSIVSQQGKIVNLKEVVIDQEHSSVKFEVVQPDYVNPKAVEFRYFLKGMQDSWSEWSSSNNVISFPYLPTGDYALQVQAKNIFGKVSELQPVPFEVLPPYWKRSWFYAMEFAVFASLVILSFRLSTRYRIVSRLLSLLTIILLMQFIQTIIGATIMTKESPVIDFFIQVIVALLVLPVEGYLRNLMLRSLDSSGKFYQFVIPKSAPGSEEKPETFIEETTDIDK